MVEGDEGDIVSEQKREQGDFVESSWNEGEQHLPKGSFCPCGEQGGGCSVDAQDERCADDRIERVGCEFAKAHFGEFQAQRSSDGELGYGHEFLDSGEGLYSAQVCGEADREGSQQVWDGQAKCSCGEVSEECEAYEQQQGVRSGIEEVLCC